MAVSESYLEYVMERLESIRPVQRRKMFGGVGLYADDRMFALISSADTLYFKVDEGNLDRFERAGAEQFHNMPYYALPADALEDPDGLAEWVESSVEVAARASQKTTKKKKKG